MEWDGVLKVEVVGMDVGSCEVEWMKVFVGWNGHFRIRVVEGMGVVFCGMKWPV